jgi:hypothetical protein
VSTTLRDASGVEAVLAVIRAIEILSPTAVRFGGERMERAPATPADAAQAESGGILIPLLTEALYGRAYARRLGWPAPAVTTPGPDEDLVPALSAANPGRERWEAGWQVRQALSTGRVIAERNGGARFLWPGEFIASDAPGTPPRPGARVTVWRPRESATLQPGFYFAFGEAAWEDEAAILRVYWNVSPDGAPALTGTVAATMNRWGVPFRYKCLSRRSLYPRTDSAVLYVARRGWRLVRELVMEVQAAVAPHLHPDPPLFARPLARGMSMAEDPGTGDSFGMSRCRMLAEGLWTAWRTGHRGTRERLDAVRQAFARGGVSLDQPWKAAASPVRYDEEGADA